MGDNDDHVDLRIDMFLSTDDDLYKNLIIIDYINKWSYSQKKLQAVYIDRRWKCFLFSHNIFYGKYKYIYYQHIAHIADGIFKGP